MEPNFITPLIKMKIDTHRAELRKNYFKQVFSLKRGKQQPINDFHILTPQSKIFIIKAKKRVSELIESEKQRDLNKLKSIISLFLEELKNDEFTSQISKTDLEEINFLSIFKIIICNIEYLKDEDLIYNFIWCLGILVMGENMDSDYLKETKTLEFLNFILLKSNYKIQSMCCFILGNLFLNAKIRDHCLELGIIDYIRSFFSKVDVPVYLVNDLLFLSNRITIDPLPPYEKVRDVLLPFYQFVLEPSYSKFYEESNLQDVLYSLSQLSNGPQNQIEDFLRLNFHQKLIDICKHHGIKAEGRLGLRILGNLVTGDNNSTEEVINAGLFQVLEFYYQSEDISEEYLLEISWIVSNILACGEKIIALALKTNLIKKIFEVPIKLIRKPLVYFFSFSFAKEGSILIFNISKSASFYQILALLDKGFLGLIKELLESNIIIVLINVCKAIKKILKKEIEWNTDSEIKNPFKEAFESKGLNKLVRELLLNEDKNVYYYSQLVLDLLENE